MPRRSTCTSCGRRWRLVRQAAGDRPLEDARSVPEGRRAFLRAAAITIGAAHLGIFGRVQEAGGREPREVAAFGRASAWINSPPLTPSNLAGKVILVDFWTYTCINWMRTLPSI